jgi:ATP-binding cassette subfamily C (CFTR/MRP) protein 4
VSIQRVQEFLDRKDVVESNGKLSDDAPYVLSFSDVTCCWEADNSASTDTSADETSHSRSAIAIEQISIKFESGKMYCIIGSVGCGKSALLQAITGELLPSQGQIARKPVSLAYAPQDPFIMDGSVKENILFGLDYDEDNYRGTVEACGLDVDFEQFQNGDGTIVGDRGVQCSGGQRARIGLARALYKDADILVADDPLSAVDAKVGRLIFYQALQDRCVAKGKCVILATHQHQFIRNETCILMAKGQVTCLGSYEECVNASGGGLQAIVDASHDMEESAQEEVKAIVPVSQGGGDEKSKDDGNGNVDSQNESKGAGAVKLSTWATYAKSMGGVYVGFFLAFLYVLAQGSVLVSIAVVGRWAGKPKNEQVSHIIPYTLQTLQTLLSPRVRTTIIMHPTQTDAFLVKDSIPTLTLVSGLTISVIILSIVRALSVFFFTVRASRNLHDEMTVAVLRAKIVSRKNRALLLLHPVHDSRL